MNTLTIDLSEVLFYLIPFIVIWVIFYKWAFKNDWKELRIFSSMILSMAIYLFLIAIYIFLQTINFKIKL